MLSCRNDHTVFGLDTASVVGVVIMIQNIDSILAQLNFNPDELACVERRGVWYMSISVMAMVTISLAVLNIATIL